jgi:hypothetical protein
MRRTTFPALLVLAVVLAVTLPVAPVVGEPRQAGEVTFASGPGWAAFSHDPGVHPEGRGRAWLGTAQNVCLNPSAPSNCPPGATLYGGSGWSADLTAIPGATWIWAPGVTRQTQGADLVHFYFSRAFVLRGHPTDGVVFVAADDLIALRVNGTPAGTWGSVKNIGKAGMAQSMLRVFDVAPFLKPGRNVITLRGQNGPSAFSPFGCDPCTYGQNPAGVVFGGSLSFAAG